MRVGVFGRGRLGGAIAQVVRESSDAELVWSVGRADSTGSGLSGLEPVDVAIDASAGSAVESHLDFCLERGAGFLIGTTGWSIPDLAGRVEERIGVLVAPNFSLTVALYARLTLVLARFAATDERKDPYLLEHHHARKLDAPSGTARLLAGVLLAGCPRKTEWVLPAPGAALQPHQLNVSSIRAGHTYSTHVVGVDSPGEVLELHHTARSAAPYAEGALAAARWLASIQSTGGRRGVFSMNQVAEELLAPLFEGGP